MGSNSFWANRSSTTERAPQYLGDALGVLGGSQLEAVVDDFASAGDVLGLACGPATWTPRLLSNSATVTAVDAAPEMLAMARQRVDNDERVRFVRADLFAWRPNPTV